MNVLLFLLGILTGYLIYHLCHRKNMAKQYQELFKEWQKAAEANNNAADNYIKSVNQLAASSYILDEAYRYRDSTIPYNCHKNSLN